MDRTIFNSRFKELQTAFGKRATEDFASLFFSKLKWISNDAFNVICDEIIENDEKFPAISRFYKSKITGGTNIELKSCDDYECMEGMVTLIDTETLHTWVALCHNPNCKAAQYLRSSPKNLIQEVPMKRLHTSFLRHWQDDQYKALPEATKVKYDKYIKRMISIQKGTYKKEQLKDPIAVKEIITKGESK